MNRTAAAPGGIIPGKGGRTFVGCGGVYLVAAVVVAIVHSTTPVTRGWWLVAFLSLVGGVSQLLLGPGLTALIRRSGARAPDRRAGRAELVLWNGGTATVAIADLAPSMVGVLVGSALLVAALTLFAADLRAARATARDPSPRWVRAYGFLLVFLAVSVVVGAYLAYARGR